MQKFSRVPVHDYNRHVECGTIHEFLLDDPRTRRRTVDQNCGEMMDTGKKTTITVGLLWHSVNSDNLGIGALTISQVAIVEEIARRLGISVGFLVICSKDPRQHYFSRQNIEIALLRRRHILTRLYKLATQCDIILDISTGDGFTDLYGLTRFVTSCVAKLAVICSGTYYILSPQTIGPFKRKWIRPVVRALLSRARTVVTRDKLTTQFLQELGVTNNVVESTDVAFRLPYQRPTTNANRRLRVGVNISGLLFNGGYTRKNMFALKADYRGFARAIIGYFASQDECELHLISHVISYVQPVEDDFRVAQALAEEFPRVIVAPSFEDPSAAKSYIAGMDFFCGSRMHACIAAFSSGVPMVPIAYSRKFAGVFSSLGYDALADCKSQSSDEMLTTVIDAYEHRDKLKKLTLRCLETAHQKLAVYESLLQETIQGVIQRRELS
jgi:colanic acid/amylovoran biosynthesis protein